MHNYISQILYNKNIILSLQILPILYSPIFCPTLHFFGQIWVSKRRCASPKSPSFVSNTEQARCAACEAAHRACRRRKENDVFSWKNLSKKEDGFQNTSKSFVNSYTPKSICPYVGNGQCLDDTSVSSSSATARSCCIASSTLSL